MIIPTHDNEDNDGPSRRCRGSEREGLRLAADVPDGCEAWRCGDCNFSVDVAPTKPRKPPDVFTGLPPGDYVLAGLPARYAQGSDPRRPPDEDPFILKMPRRHVATLLAAVEVYRGHVESREVTPYGAEIEQILDVIAKALAAGLNRNIKVGR